MQLDIRCLYDPKLHFEDSKFQELRIYILYQLLVLYFRQRYFSQIIRSKFLYLQ